MPEEEIKRVMDEMPYGLYIIGSKMDGECSGMMADWVMQVSFNPRLVAVAFENDARTLEAVRSAGGFSVNMLSQDKDGMELAARFAQPYRASKVKGRKGADADKVHHKMQGIAYAETDRGMPVLDEAMAWLDCQLDDIVPVGDHTLVIGRIVEGRLLRESEPLTSLYTGWTYSG